MAKATARSRRPLTSADDTSIFLSDSGRPGAGSPARTLSDGVDAELDQLPNDLTRMICLASMRDCNTGIYLHPMLSSSMGVDAANYRLRSRHDEIFRRLLESPISSYVAQLGEYICYTRAKKDVMLGNWRSLQAYRATIPAEMPPLWCELFFLNIDAAIAILQHAPQAPVP